jgi:HlyD family secretion protein
VAEFTPKTVETEDLRTKLVYEVRVFVHDSKDMLRLGMPTTVVVDRNTSADVSQKNDVFPQKTTNPVKG